MTTTALTVSISGTDYYVYADIAMADEYLAADPNTTNWDAAADDPAKAQWLVQATRILDRQRWPGTKYEAEQELAWPRTGTGISGVEEDITPLAIRHAAIELALALSNGYDAANNQTTDANIKSLKAGSVAIEYFLGAGGTPLRFPLPVWELIKPYLTGSSVAAGVESFGTCEPSAFETGYGLSQPL